MKSFRSRVFDASDRPLPDAGTKATPIVQALRVGLTAPSAHNTQPWSIDIRSGTEATLYCDPARTLPLTDPPGRQIHISHGTLVELTAIAATRLGYRADIDVLPEGAMDLPEFGNRPTAHIRLVAAEDVATDPLIDRVAHRRTSRHGHDGPRVTDAEFQRIVDQSDRPGVTAAMVPEAHFAEALDLVRRAMAIEVNDRNLYGETLTWFRFSSRRIAETGDGLNLYTSGLAGPALQVARLVNRPRTFHAAANRASFLASFDRTVDSTRGLLTLATPTNSMADWINTGRRYIRAQLVADALGLQFQPVSQALQEFPQMDDVRAAMDALVGVRPPGKLQMLVRVGRGRRPALSPRRDFDAFLNGPPDSAA